MPYKHDLMPYQNYCGDPSDLSDPSCMSRLSMSLKVNGTATDRSATYDFLLVIHRKHGLLLFILVFLFYLFLLFISLLLW